MTQWLFLKLWEKGLAYRKRAPVNWCPSCQTVLANEQVTEGLCERCASQVTRREMTQWFFKITAYADRLLAGLEKLDWPEKTKALQKHWIGKSEGCEIVFRAGEKALAVFTTRPDTLMGVTYLVLAPEHPLVEFFTGSGQQEEVKAYLAQAARRSDIQRSLGAEKTGVFTGGYVRHPITGESLPVWVSDYVLAGYAKGAVMAVPAHDERDYQFARRYLLPIKEVVQGKGPLPFSGEGFLVNSGAFNGLSTRDARREIARVLKEKGNGGGKVQYRLHDWLVSRQRYWGAPIPVIYCPDCGAVPVPESHLPVRLPYRVQFAPGGQSPLAGCGEFVNTQCPCCGAPARRETDTLDTFVCSSWYFLRFFDSKNEGAAFSTNRANAIMPVDKYVGGIEHATMHLLYARFITMALHDMGYVNFEEPFPSLVHQGIVLGADGKKMSKRDGAVSPDQYIARYGADVFRLYLGFGFRFLDGGPWKEEGIAAVARFVGKVSRIAECFLAPFAGEQGENPLQEEKMEYARNYAIKQVAADYESFQFNTAIARIMEFANAIAQYQKNPNRSLEKEKSYLQDMLLLLAPMAPHFTEEVWEKIGGPYSVHSQPFPVCEEEKMQKQTVEIAVQVNGKLKQRVCVPAQAGNEMLQEEAMRAAKVAPLLAGKKIIRIVVVPGKLVNIVC